MTDNPSIALIHDWLVTMRGGEKALEALCELYPGARLCTLVHRQGSCSEVIEAMDIRTSPIQDLPYGIDHYQYYLPLFPTAVRTFNLKNFDIVISSSHAAAKGVRVSSTSLHFCYCYTPMRYIWDQYESYFGKGRAPWPQRLAMRMMLGPLRRWDLGTARKVDYFIAISRNVQERIKRIYRRESLVIYPPVDVGRFSLSGRDDGYFLVVSALVPYKRVDLAVEAFNDLGARLLVIGTGPELKRLQSRAKKNIEFLGWVSEGELPGYYAGARALIFPGEEDFGIVPVEAMACGKPVIAYGRGGALETVTDGVSGILFTEQTRESLTFAVKRLDSLRLDAAAVRSGALRFDVPVFKERLSRFVQDEWQQFLIRRG